MTLLQVEGLKVDINADDAPMPILKGLDLEVKPGEVHAIMGPNGSGKSTLANVLAGRPGYRVTQGSIRLDGDSLLDLAPEERAQRGLFLAFSILLRFPASAIWNSSRPA